MDKAASRASRKAAQRLIPFLILCYLVGYLDRVNVGVAALTMNKELGLTAEMFGFGVGIFFFGYAIFEVPSNLILERVGARRRVMFGAAEAGFYPGIILYLTYWFTADERARWVGVFFMGNPLASVIGGPIAGFILDTLNGSMGLGGWQWLFIIEGVPSVLVGLWALRHLTDKPIKAAWLDPDERLALQAKIDHERKSREAIRHYKLGEALTNPRVLGLSLVLFGLLCGQYGLVYWLPQIIKGVATDIGLDKVTGVSINALTGYLVAVPFAFATVAMIWWTRHSDVTHERVWHVVCPAVVSGLSLIAAAYLGNPILAAVALTICAMGVYAATPTFWSLPTGFLTGSAAAGGLALINSIGNIGGFAGPYAIGWIKDATGEITLGLVVLAAGPDSKIEMAGGRMMAE
jgi:ACS family tartrate transporter-like MFS transporter